MIALVIICLSVGHKTKAQKIRPFKVVYKNQHNKSDSDTVANYLSQSDISVHRAFRQVVLFKKNRFKYYEAAYNQIDSSEGTYSHSKSNLILNSDLQKEKIEVEVKNISSAKESVYRSKIACVTNSVGDTIHFIIFSLNHNNEQLYSLQEVNQMLRDNFELKAIRVNFYGRKFSTRWADVTENQGDILITIRTTKNPDSYSEKVFTNKKFKKRNETLIEFIK